MERRAPGPRRAGGTGRRRGSQRGVAAAPDLAAVVVLDEGDEALQEERVPTWHGRDVAVERARRVGAPVTLVAPVPTPRPPRGRTGWYATRAARSGPAGRRSRSSTSRRAAGQRAAQRGARPALHRTVDAGEHAVCVLNRKGRAKL